MANILCLDFDDTVVLENTARLIFERFAKPSWREFEAEYHRGRLSVEQFNAAALATVEATAEELRSFSADSVTPRDGLLELFDWALWNDWVPVVVSNGFDFYVDAVLDGLGADRVARHTGRTRFDYQWRVTYFSPRGIGLEDGFKLSYAAAFQNSGDFVAYAGDGASDVPAAGMAQAVFARSTLLERLHGVHPRVFPFETMTDITKVLAEESAAWLASGSTG
ncbi:MAG: HAD-IB family phosphatase [bacterium]